MRICLFLLLATTLFATVNEPLRFEIFSGYRNDRTHWHLKDGEVVTDSGLYRDVEYWENGLQLKAIHRDLTFFLRGAYGGLGTPDRWTADGMGYFGYAVNLTADRLYKVIFTPLLGYSAYFEQLKRLDPGFFRQAWYGFFFGCGFTIEPVGRLVFNVGYSYHLLHNRVHAATFKTDSTGDHGHTGWAQMDIKLTCLWRMGLGADIHYFTTRVVDAKVDHILKQHFKLRWTSISGWLQISRGF